MKKYEQAETDLSNYKSKCLQQATALEASKLTTANMTTQIKALTQEKQKLESKVKASEDSLFERDQRAADTDLQWAKDQAINEESRKNYE